MESNKIITIPNVISLIRIILVPIIYYLAIRQYLAYALSLYAVGVLTDFFDGYLARKYKQESSIGRKLDAFADSIYIIATALGLYYLGYITLIIAVIILSQRLITGLIFLIFSRKKFFTTIYAKIASTILYVSIIPIILKYNLITTGCIIFVYLFSIIHWTYIIKKSMKKYKDR